MKKINTILLCASLFATTTSFAQSTETTDTIIEEEVIIIDCETTPEAKECESTESNEGMPNNEELEEAISCTETPDAPECGEMESNSNGESSEVTTQ